MTPLPLGRRLLGLLLVALTVFPVYRLLDSPDTGFAGSSTVSLSDMHSAVLWYGALVALIPTLVLARLVRPDLLNRWLVRIGQVITAPRSGTYALALALIAGMVTLSFSLYILEGKPNLIDAMSQLVHARYLAEGRLAGPVLPEGAFWHLQNSVITLQGWVSQYPPGHLVLLAAGFRLGAVWLIGPLLMAITVFFTSLAAERLLPENPVAARLGAVAVALSPFLIGLAGAYMNHITAAALGAIAVYCALRARDGRLGWALPTGAAVGWSFATRPLAALSIAAVAGLGIWLSTKLRGRRLALRWAAQVALATLGALPFLLALGAYNAYFFGSPTRFGYDHALGPTAGLGFGRDPWGNWYGPRQALGYTSSDLVALNLNLLETMVPAVVVVGLYLCLARRLSRGERILTAWALLPVFANLFYWHHGIFMGPRMLNEAAPAWGVLAVVAALGLVRAVPDGWQLLGGTYSIRVMSIIFLLIAGVIGYAVSAPRRLLGYADFMPSTRIQPPRPDTAALIFVHGAWTGRFGMRLAASGMRLDSLETAVRQNTACQVQIYTDHRLAAGRVPDSPAPSTLDFEPRSVGFPRRVEISPGNWAAIGVDEALTEGCRREIYADRNGIIDVAPLLWQGDLPGLTASRGAFYVRDLGPELNAELIRKFPERLPLMYYQPAPDTEPALVPYEEGVAAIWGGKIPPNFASFLQNARADTPAGLRPSVGRALDN